MKALDKLRTLLSDARVYWRRPPAGNYINYRSIFAYAFGGIGVYALIYINNTLTVSATNVVIANATGLDPNRHLLPIYYLSFFISIFATGYRAKVIDAARSKKGKYRPYIVSMGIPTAVIALTIVFFPFRRLKSTALVFLVVLVLNVLLHFFYAFFSEAYTNLIYVMSPNSQERSNVLGFKAIVYSSAPTVLNPLIPMVQKWMGSSDIYDIRIYRAVFPVTAVAGVLLSCIVYAYTEEKIVQAKSHVVQVNFFDALRAVLKNKYFWIISLAGWIGFMESNSNYILGWLYNYANWATNGQYSIITLISGNASLWGMLFSPLAIKKFGKKRVLIFTNLLNIVFLLLLFPAVGVAKSIWAVLLCLYFNTLINASSQVMTPSLNADIRDYQHYISGERIDGMFAAVGLIGSAIGLLTGTVTPAVFNAFGINDRNGYDAAYDILKYEPDVLFKLIYVLIGMSVVGAALNVIPYFFYDLSETRQKAMVKILRVRAMFEDFFSGSLSDEQLIEGVDLVRQARAAAASPEIVPSKADISQAGTKAEKRAAKKVYKAQKTAAAERQVGLLVYAELEKYATERVRLQVREAGRIVAAGREGLTSFDAEALLCAAKRLPKSTPEEKAIRTDEADRAKALRLSQKNIRRHYPNGLPEYDSDTFHRLLRQADALETELGALIRKRNATPKDAPSFAVLHAQVREKQQEKVALEREIKSENRRYTLYLRAVRPYLDAKKLLNMQDAYARFDEIEARYDEAKARVEEKHRLDEAEKQALEEKRRAEKEAFQRK